MASKEKVGQRMQFAGVTFGYLDPVTLRPNPMNYQTHPEEQTQAISESIEEFGWVGFPIFNERTGTLIDGHARVKEARKRGQAGVVCVLVDLPPEKADRLLLSYDRIGRLAQTDDHLLARLLRDCADDLPAGWTADDVGDVLLRVDAAETPSQPADRSERPERRERQERGRREDEEAGEPSVAGDLRGVQLFYPAARMEAFRQMVEFFQADMGLRTASEVVFEVLRDAYEGEG